MGINYYNLLGACTYTYIYIYVYMFAQNKIMYAGSIGETFEEHSMTFVLCLRRETRATSWVLELYRVIGD